MGEKRKQMFQVRNMTQSRAGVKQPSGRKKSFEQLTLSR
jgi:hypothetical protein